MRHPDESTIHAWLDGALDAVAAAAVEAHVAGCAECAAAVAEARGLIAASSRILSALDHVPGGVLPGTARGKANPVTALTAVAAAAPHTARGRQVPRRTRWRWGTPQLAAAAVLMLAVGSYAVLRSGGERVAVDDATAERAAAPTAQAFARVDSSAAANSAAANEPTAQPPVDAAATEQRRAPAEETARRELAPSAPRAGAAPPPAVRDTVMLSAKVAAADQMAARDSTAANMPLPTTARLRGFAPVESRAQSLAVGVDALVLEPSAWIGRCFQAAIEPAAVSPNAISDFSRLTAALPPEFRLDSAVVGERGERARFAAVPRSSGDSTVTGWWSVAADTGIRVEFSGATTDRVQLMVAQSAADWPATRASLYAYGSRRSTTLSVHLTPIVCGTPPTR